ncbi:MAG: XdhC family protein [Verrucomicrobiota bacterium]|nr:XdhC family protein [Verrucomicrobiota bacterium]
MKEIADILRAIAARDDAFYALATLVRATGSSYRRPGARMLIRADGATAGSLSGGCLEDEVAVCAREILRTGEPQLMEFDTRLRFGCHGKIEIFVERLPARFFAEMAARFHGREHFGIATHFEAEPRQSVLLDDKTPTPDAFVQEIEPQIALLIFGDGPDSEPLRTLAKTLGWKVASSESPLAFDARTAAIVKTHNYGRDFVALRQLLPRGLRYVGLLGPRQRRDQLVHALLEEGVAITSQFFAPAGLDLHADTPEEIALSIITEIQTVFAGGSGASLRNRKVPIHEIAACTASPR